MPEASGLQARESSQATAVDRRPLGDVLLENGGHGVRSEVREDHHADTARALAPPFNGYKNRNGAPILQLSTPFDSRLRPADPGVVDLDLAVERLARRIDHGPAQLMEHHPRGFIPAESELALEQERGDAALVGRHQIRGPEPLRQRGFRVVQNRSSRQRHLMPAPGALPASIRQGVRTRMSATRTREALRPATRSQVLLAGLVGRELSLKLAQILGKGRAWHALHYRWWRAETTG